MQVFDKALIEPKFCELYADLCYQLNSVLPDFEDPEGRTDAKGNPARVNFRKMLINKCQAEFEKGSEAKAAVDKRDRAKADAGKVKRYVIEILAFHDCIRASCPSLHDAWRLTCDVLT